MRIGRTASRIRIGISGWRYAPWRGVFYPADLPQRGELAYAASVFSSIEINGSFYSLQKPAYYERWHDATPDDFVFSVKAPRYITHILRLRDPASALANFFASGVFRLRRKFGPILWQLPPSLRFDENLLRAFLELLPQDTDAALSLARRREPRMKGRASLRVEAPMQLRYALEIRNESFDHPRLYDLLRQHHVALVIADSAGKWPLLENVTADYLYLRLHGAEELYASGYTEDALRSWAERIRRWSAPSRDVTRDVYCYFDNDMKVRAPFDANRLEHILNPRTKLIQEGGTQDGNVTAS